VQEAFLGVWRLTGALVPGRAQASTLIMTIVHRRAVDLVRREQRHRAAPLASASHPATDSTEEATELRLQREHVQAALRQLPDEHRKPIELAYYGGLTQSEVANWLGQPLGTIKSRMFAGLARLRKLMENVASPERPGSSHERERVKSPTRRLL
jgi:RNA polymerase sigma-70 factor, ECF subfamily